MALRNRPWILLALILGLILASLLGLFGVTYLRARNVIDEFAAESERQAEEWRRTGVVRPPVFGGPFEGNAWDVYQAALSGWKRSPGMMDDLPPTIVQEFRRALGTDAQPPGLDAQLTTVCQQVCIDFYLATKQMEKEQPEACLERVTVLIGLKQDVQRNFGDLSGLGGSHLAYESWKTILERHRLSPAALRELSARLEGLERTMPTAAQMLWTELAAFRHPLRNRILSREDKKPPGWKVFWSSTIEAAATLKAIEEEVPKLVAKCRLPRAGRLAQVVEYELDSEIGPRAFELCEREDAWVREYATVRLAVALARFEADRGTFPARLEELVPDYLAALPGNLPDDFDVRYEAGKLTTRARHQEQVWKFRR